MTADFIARIVQKTLDQLDLINPTAKQLNNFNRANGLLETYLNYNLFTFEETELVFKWAPNQCKLRNLLLNQQRAFNLNMDCVARQPKWRWHLFVGRMLHN